MVLPGTRREQELKNELAQAEKGDMPAIKSLILRHQQGNGVKKSEAEAARWSRRLAELQKIDANATLAQAENGDLEAMNKLAGLYRAGEGVPQSEEQAKAWSDKRAQIMAMQAAQKKAAEDLKAFHFLPIAKKNAQKGGMIPDPPEHDPSSLATWILFTALPSQLASTFADVVTLPFRLPEYNRLKKAAAGHAAAWQNPDSLMAQAFAQHIH